MLPVECVARAYLTGGGLGSTPRPGPSAASRCPTASSTVDRLPEPIFTPVDQGADGRARRADPRLVVEAELGAGLAAEVRDLTVAILAARQRDRRRARHPARRHQGRVRPARRHEVVLADEVLTPDSSRFWPADQWEPGHAQPVFDKQFVRDWLTSPASGWSKSSGEASAAAARRRRRADPGEVRRGLRAAHRRDLLTGDRAGAVGGTSPSATESDLARLLSLWALVYGDEVVDEGGLGEGWAQSARDWFVRVVDDGATARFPVVEVDGVIVATAIGTLELGVPNPHCARGRTARLANVITVPEQRGHGIGTLLVGDVVEWAR